jgi:hypothetical protein
MREYVIMDEQNRIIRSYWTMERRGYRITHSFSYLYAREQMKSMGSEMGLDNPCLHKKQWRLEDIV